MDRAGLLMRLEKAWEELKNSYGGLSEQEMLEPGVAGTWSVKDVIAHVTCWEEEALTHLPLILKGGRPPRYSVLYGGIDAFNARMSLRSQAFCLSQVIERRDFVHSRLLDFIRGVPEEQIVKETRFRRRLRLDTYGHYLEHARALRNWRKSKGLIPGNSGLEA